MSVIRGVSGLSSLVPGFGRMPARVCRVIPSLRTELCVLPVVVAYIFRLGCAHNKCCACDVGFRALPVRLPIVFAFLPGFCVCRHLRPLCHRSALCVHFALKLIRCFVPPLCVGCTVCARAYLCKC